MKTKNYNPLKELPKNICKGFAPMARLEVLLCWGSTGMGITGICDGDPKKIVGGFVAAALSGIYAAYKDGVFEDKNKY